MANIPSIQTLRAFDAAARHQSYTRAARELGLTHSAISHRIRELEERQQCVLFRRQGNRMLPTHEGQRLLAHVRTSLNLLELAFVAPSERGRRRRISLDVLPAFAVRWLATRLHLVRTELPLLELELRATTELSDLSSNGIDAAIRFGPGEWPDVQAKRLNGEVLFPVCSPDYRARLNLGRPADLGRCNLLRHPWQAWIPWFRAAGLDRREPQTGSIYADAGLLLQAAASGEGVALARGLLALDDLRSGRLVRLFDVSVADRYSYYLVRPLRAAPNPVLGDFQNWLARTIAADSSDAALCSR
jgi:LysR family glycine cleavage system transcriptional activator